MSPPAIKLPAAGIEQFCRRWRIVELSLFGSALRTDFDEGSDVDFLVTFAADADWSLLDHVTMRDELAALVGRPVDLLTRRSVEMSDNWIRRNAILSSAKSVYAA